MRNVLITGVSRGLGLKTAEILLQNGYQVFGISRNESPELKILSETNKDRFHFMPFDLTDVDQIQEKIFNEFIPFSTPLYGIVNNAALAYDDLISNLNLDSLTEMYKINVFAPMQISKLGIRNMLFHDIAGSIVHISSISVHTGYKGLAMYASTKGALEAFSKNLAREWGARGIRSNSIVAGFMETDMSSSLSAEQKKKIYQRTSLKTPTDPDSVANTIEFLLSDRSKSITGHNIFVDSGTI